MSNKDQILVVIPAYNEEKNIAMTINNVKTMVPYADILVVDDGSIDKTAEIATKLDVLVVSIPINLGIGGAMQTGFQVAKKLCYDIVIQVDADGQHDPVFTPLILEPIVQRKADISIGSRYIEGRNVKFSLTRNLGIKFFSWLTTKITGCQITDCSSGFRALSRTAIEIFADEYPVDFPDAEAIVFAHKRGLKITEIAVQFRCRSNGKSSLSFWRLLWYPVKELFSILMFLTKREGIR